jgi:hypothetical protein
MDDVLQHVPARRLGTDLLERSDPTTARFTCATCGAARELSFATVDHLVAADLHAGLDGAPIDDDASRRFDLARPVAPGDRALELACATCGARARLVAHGGEQSREGVLEWHLIALLELAPSRPDPAPAPAPTSRRLTPAAIVLVLAIVALGAVFGVAAWNAERQRRDLVERGVRTRATIIDETTRWRGPGSVDVRWTDEAGELRSGSFEVPMLSGWHAGDEQIDIVYDPRTPDRVVAARGGLRPPWAFTVAAVVLVLGGLLLGQRLSRVAGQ